MSLPDLAGADLAGADLASAGGDLAQSGDSGVGAPCNSACDCTAGLYCDGNGACAMLAQPIYCCSSNTCPNGQLCQRQNGDVSTCGGPGDAGDPCPRVPCIDANTCDNLGCGACLMGMCSSM
jgi:hypothetical protein